MFSSEYSVIVTYMSCTYLSYVRYIWKHVFKFDYDMLWWLCDDFKIYRSMCIYYAFILKNIMIDAMILVILI